MHICILLYREEFVNKIVNKMLMIYFSNCHTPFPLSYSFSPVILSECEESCSLVVILRRSRRIFTGVRSFTSFRMTTGVDVQNDNGCGRSE